MTRLIVTYILLFLVAFINGQDTITSRQLFERAEFMLFNKDFKQASKIYESLLEQDSLNKNICFHLSLCYLNIGENKKSVYYLKKMLSNSTLSSFDNESDYYVYLGKMYRLDNKTDTSSITNPVTGYKFDPYRPYNNIAISGDGNTLVFASSYESENRIYFLLKAGNTWSDATNITTQVGSTGDCFPSSLSYDGKRLYITKYNGFESDIYVSILKGKTWSGMKKLNGNINTLNWDAHACESQNGQVLYFSSNRPGGFGGMDIYFAVKANNDWGKAVNCGARINTYLNEDYPLFINDDKTLIFSSQGFKKGRDGFDIYFCNSISENMWSVATNLGYPVNTSEDDLTYVPLTDESKAFFNLSLQEAKQSKGKENSKNLELKVKIGDKNDKAFVSNLAVQIIDNSTGSVVKTTNTDGNGKCSVSLQKGDYTFQYLRDTIVAKKINMFLPFIIRDDTAVVTIPLKKLRY